jgi:hypothetical protein
MNGISFSLYDALNKPIILLPIMLSGWWQTLCQNETTMACYFMVACFVCGLALWLVLSKIGEHSTGIFFGSNSDEVIDKSFKEIQQAYPDYDPFNGEANENNQKKCYLSAYYRVQQAGLIGNIPVLEALSEFFKCLVFAVISSVLPSLFLVFLYEPCLYKQFGWYYLVAIIFSTFMSYWGRKYTEYKIHYLVWEADYFLAINSK